jgi:hypothetical protein
VQHHSTCERNPLALDVLPRRVYPVRGAGIAAAYQEATVDLGTGRYTVTVFAETNREAARAVRRLRRCGQEGPPRRLRAPRYPTAVMRELKRVAVARQRTHSVKEAARAIGLSSAQTRMRLRIARLLGTAALKEVRAPTRPWRVVRRERKAAMFAQAEGVAAAARRFGVSRAELRAMIRRVRGLTGRC